MRFADSERQYDRLAKACHQIALDSSGVRITSNVMISVVSVSGKSVNVLKRSILGKLKS